MTTIPDAPGALPLVGHLWSFYKDLPGLYAAGRKLAPVYRLRMGAAQSLAVVSGDDLLKHFKSPSLSSENYTRDVGRVLGGSLLALDGPPHRRMRTAIAPLFANAGLTAAKVGPKMAEIIRPRVAELVQQGRFNIGSTARELALDVIFGVYGVSVDELPEWRRQYEAYSLGALPFPWDLPGFPARKARLAQEWIDARLQIILDEARRNPATERSFVTALIEARDPDGNPLTDVEIIGNLRLVVFAGHETTAAALAWTCFFLAADPAHWRRITAEVQAFGGMPLVPQDIAKVPYTVASFREAMRLRPPVPIISRMVVDPIEVHGITISKGETVSYPIVDAGRDEAKFPDPAAFRPERWLDGKLNGNEANSFGSGPHFCLGAPLALMEGAQFLSALALAMGPNSTLSAPGGMPDAVYLPTTRPVGKTEIVLN